MRRSEPKYWLVEVVVAAMLAACGDSGAGNGITDDAPSDDTTLDDSTSDDSASGGMPSDDTADPDGQAGASGASVADCEAADPATSEVDAQGLFDYPHVPTFDFYLPTADWVELQDNAQAEEYVQAQVCFEGRLVGTVGLRFKGYYGSLYGCFDEQGEMICPRLSMKAKFNEYVADQRFYGLKRLNFNAYRYDDSRMKERLTYDLFRSMGVYAPRAAWAIVRVNGESQGLYGMVEQVDGRFTADRWPEHPDGNLYKEAWPTTTSESALSGALSTNEEQADVSAFAEFSRELVAADEENLLDTLASFVDLDYLARYMAVDDAVANYDGITYFWTDGTSRNNHNFYFYEEAPNRFHLIPWDVESSFWINPDHAAPHWTEIPEDCSLTYPYWDGLASAPGCDAVFRALGGDLDRWRAASRELLDGPFALDTMLETIDRHAAFIGDAARADKTPNMYGTFDASVEYLRSGVADMRARLESLIAE